MDDLEAKYAHTVIMNLPQLAGNIDELHWARAEYIAELSEGEVAALLDYDRRYCKYDHTIRTKDEIMARLTKGYINAALGIT